MARVNGAILLRSARICAGVGLPPLSGLAEPAAGSANPDKGGRPTPAQIRADLSKIAPLTRAIRLYSSTGGVEMVPRIAAEFGLHVTVGAWIDKNTQRN